MGKILNEHERRKYFKSQGNFNPDSPITKLEHNSANLKALLETQYLQRVFWIELTHKLEGFELRVIPMGYNYYEHLFIKDKLIAPEDKWFGGEDTYSPCMIPKIRIK